MKSQFERTLFGLIVQDDEGTIWDDLIQIPDMLLPLESINHGFWNPGHIVNHGQRQNQI